MSNKDPKAKNSGAQQNEPVSKNKMIILIAVFVLAACLCVGAVIAVIQTIRNDNPTEPTVDTEALAEAARNTIAITIGDHQLTAVELNYFYQDTLNNFYSNYYYQIYYYGLIDLKTPLNQQYFDKENNITWADYFLSLTEDSIKSTYLLSDLAAEQGFTLSAEEQEYVDSLPASITESAKANKYENVDDFVAAVFGYGADLESYMAYFERALLADAFYAHYAESLEFTDEQMREFESDSKHLYNSYTYATYLLDASKFLTGGTEDSDGKITYTDEQIAASVEAAREAAEALNGSSCETLEAFNQLILSMDVNSSLDSVSVKEQSDVFYDTIDASMQEWIISEERVYGDVTVVAKKTTSGTGENAKETITGYYIVWYGGFNDNTMMLKDVRHILVLFKNAEGKTYSDGITSFTEEQKAAAKAEAEALLAQWQAGAATEDSFAELARLKTEDGGSKSTGGLYENIYPGQMVENFENWCFEEGRQHGDTGLVESVYGYHIMFFVGDSDNNYRDYMILSVMRSEHLNEWHDALLKSAELTVLNTEYCPMDKTLLG